jgi:hypothetical protein
VLLMGPLYHLLEEAGRVQSVEAALRLLKPDGLLYASFISMSGGLVYFLKFAPEMLNCLDDNDKIFINALKNGGHYAGTAFTQAFFIQPCEVLPFMSRFPLEKLHYLGQESFLSPNEDNVMNQPPDTVAAWLDLAEALCEREDFLSWSEHLMYIGRKSTEEPSCSSTR